MDSELAVSSSGLSRIKVIFLGSSGVGKTAIITRFTENYWVEKSIPTIGIDFTGRTLVVDNNPIRIQIWDTAGQERFHSLIPTYLREARGAVVVYDVCSKESFFEVRRWLNEVRSARDNEVDIIIVGNKTDRIEEREVSTEEGRELAESEKLPFIEVSARNGRNIKQLFEELARKIHQTPIESPPYEEKVFLGSQKGISNERSERSDDNKTCNPYGCR